MGKIVSALKNITNNPKALIYYLSQCVCDDLSVFWKSVVPLYCGDSSLCVGLDEWLVKASWLGKLVSVCWWVELGFSIGMEAFG